jgi:hypothetical protein
VRDQMKVLEIQSSPRGESSGSILLTKSFIEACNGDAQTSGAEFRMAPAELTVHRWKSHTHHKNRRQTLKDPTTSPRECYFPCSLKTASSTSPIPSRTQARNDPTIHVTISLPIARPHDMGA